MSDANCSLKIRKQICLTKDAVRQGEVLKSVMCRPSFSNVVEALIAGEHSRQFPADKSSHVEQTQAAQQDAEAA